jgi:hypothetical protein
MQMTFRLECPKCHWGHEFRDSYINKGFLKGVCQHCGNTFFFKVTVMGVDVQVCQEPPKDAPWEALPEAKTKPFADLDIISASSLPTYTVDEGYPETKQDLDFCPE